ncbi:MAG: MFS transporter [Holosporaceae bacterium]|nr:MFS transporter [Holosporaceae bacterium]
MKINMKNCGSYVGALGNVLEWYNFALFMPFLHIISEEFFPLENVEYKEILVFFAMSIGLFTRPLGAAVLGPIGDKFGRRKAISVSILLMVIPTVCMGLLPNYEKIGILAPILLILFRAMQGISLGGEYAAAMIHLVECAPPGKRGFYGSLSDAGSQIGVLLSGQSLVLLYFFFSQDEIYSFAWRIPFLLAATLFPFAFLIPDDVSEKNNEKPKESIFSALNTYKKEVVCTAAVTSFSAVAFYTLLTFFPYYLVNSNMLSLKEATTCSVYATLTMTISILVGGYFCDFYSKKFFMRFGVAGVSVTVFTMFLSDIKSFEGWLILQLLYGAFIGAYYSSRAAFFTDAFPAHVRCTAVSLSLSLAQAVFGGLTPVVMSQLTKISPFLSVVPIACVSCFAFWALAVLEEKK